MIFNFPYYRSPYYSKYYNSNLAYKSPNSYYPKFKEDEFSIKNLNSYEDNIKKEDNNISSENEKKSSNDTRQFFDIMGIKLYFDDILIICLLLFLYEEGVKDQYLFISLILLLLS